MSILSKLKSLSGIEQYKYYAEVLRRSPLNPFYFPTDWQYSDWTWMDQVDEGVLVRACGGSKTFDAVNWIILRVTLFPHEKWAWLAAASGQLTQARFYFQDHMFVKNIKGGKGEEVINLHSGGRILLRGATAGITGLRLDGIILDEEEMLQPRQIEIVYPQLHGRLTFSSIGKFFHLGTLQADAPLFMDNIEKFPTKIHPWDQCPWLVKAGHIQRMIDEGNTPDWEIDMLYRCIPSIPGGKFFHRMAEVELFKYDPDQLQWGFDFGGTDHGIGLLVDGDVATICEEREVDLESYNDAFDDLKGRKCQAEGGWYNEDVRYSAKAQMLARRIGAKKQLPTNKWKKDIKMYVRHFKEIRVIRKQCPNVWKDMMSTTFGLDGLWLKDKRHPCHWVDAVMMSFGSGLTGKIYGPRDEKKTIDRFRYIAQQQKKRRR